MKREKAKVVSLISSKGGVGKTTVAANLGGILADMGMKVCMIDADLQPSLSSHYEITERAPHGLTQFMTNLEVHDFISKTQIERLSIIVSDDPDAELINWIRKSQANFYYLMAAVNRLRGEFDYIIIDSEGVVKSELQEAVVIASDILLCPIVPDYKSAKEFARGTMRLLNRVKPPEGVVVPYDVPPLYGLINSKDRTRANETVAQELRSAFSEVSDTISLLETVIPDISAYNLACGMQQPAHRVEPKRPKGRKSPTPLETMTSMVHELFPELDGVKPSWKLSSRLNGITDGKDNRRAAS